MKITNRNYCYIFRMGFTWYAITTQELLGRFKSFEMAYNYCKDLGYNMEELKWSRKKQYAFIEYNDKRTEVIVTIVNKVHEPLQLAKFTSMYSAYQYVVAEGYYAVILSTVFPIIKKLTKDSFFE